MSAQHRWTIGLATSTGLLGLTLTSGLTYIANRFVDEFSRPHELIDESTYTWKIPSTHADPALEFQRPLLFKAADGTLLRGDFWAQPHPAPTVILCHGYRVSRHHMRPAAALEYASGYNILLFDFRGHGHSDSVSTSGGNVEVRDLEAAIFAASQQPETLRGRIILHGFSMGASVALLMPPHADVAAIIADSPYASSNDIVRRIVAYQLAMASDSRLPQLHQLRHLIPAAAWAIVATSAIIFRLRFGHRMNASPLASLKRRSASQKVKKARTPASVEQGATLSPHDIPILLIHSTDDELIPIAHSRQIEAEAKAYHIPLETLFIEGGGHCGSYLYDPKRYHNTIHRFLARCLGDDLPEQHRPLEEA